MAEVQKPSNSEASESAESEATSTQSEALLERSVQSEVPGLPYLPITRSKREVGRDEKPLWRGWIHAVTFPLAVAAGIVLVTLADGAAAKISCAVFMVSSMLLFGNSALYHLFNWGPRMKLALKRIDHANIFLLIAGSYTPLAVLALPSDKATILLTAVWSVAVLGILFRVFWVGAPRWLYVPIYVGMGWAAVMFMGDFFAASPVTMILVIAGGLCYTVGAVIYGFKKPNPFPGIFGFHEIFHALTVVAFTCHIVGIYFVAINPPFAVA